LQGCGSGGRGTATPTRKEASHLPPLPLPEGSKTLTLKLVELLSFLTTEAFHITSRDLADCGCHCLVRLPLIRQLVEHHA
jgi:hypothetical protein